MDYLKPGATLTPEQGLAESYGARDDLVTGRGSSERAREFFRCHDTAHVVFGCGTILPEEAIVKTWSLFGTTAGLSLLHDYRLPESQEIYRTLTWNEIARARAFAPGYVPIVLGRFGCASVGRGPSRGIRALPAAGESRALDRRDPRVADSARTR